MTRAFAIVPGLLGLAVLGLASPVHFAHRGAAAGAAASGPAPPARAGAPEGSLYDLGVRVIGSDGRPLHLERLRGRPVIATMFFASCPSVCPLLIRDLKQLVAGLPSSLRDEVRVLLVSFDPERDSPSVLASVIAWQGLDSAQWAVGTAENTDAAQVLAGALGVRYRAGAAGQFEHTTRVTVLDEDGHVRVQTGDLKTVATVLRAIESEPRRAQ